MFAWKRKKYNAKGKRRICDQFHLSFWLSKSICSQYSCWTSSFVLRRTTGRCRRSCLWSTRAWITLQFCREEKVTTASTASAHRIPENTRFPDQVRCWETYTLMKRSCFFTNIRVTTDFVFSFVQESSTRESSFSPCWSSVSYNWS